MRIGLAMSGGGARGMAHLGALKALEEMNVEIAEVSGTSAGAIAGAFYCSGYSPDEILDIISNMGFLKSVRPAWTWSGLLNMEGFREMLHKYLPDNRFDKLKIPLTVAATEIRMGKVTYFDSGELIPAVIASSSIPALFSPSQFNGNLYVDGGLMDNLPVRPLIGKCDIIIGSQCNPVQQRFDVKSVKEITERSLLLAISVNSTQSKSHCNIVIEPPELAKFGTFDLARGKEIFAIGYNYTRESFKVEDFQLKKDDSLYED